MLATLGQERWMNGLQTRYFNAEVLVFFSGWRQEHVLLFRA